MRKPWMLFLCMLIALPAFALEWHESYERGKKEVEKGNCSQGVPLLLQAVEKKPKDDLRARPYGTITIEYIPHFYLAKCAMERGDLAAAEKYIDQGDASGVGGSKKRDEYMALKRDYLAKKKLAEAQQPPPIDQPPTREDPEEIRRKKEQQRQADIRLGIQTAQQALNGNRLTEARQAAQRVLALDPGNVTAQQVLADVNDREAERDRRIRARQEKLDQARRAFRENNLQGAESLALQLQQEYPGDREVIRLLEDIRKKKQTESAQLKAEEAIKQAEKQVIVAYFSGQYEAVIQLVESNSSKFGNSWRLPFYQGCAYASLSLLEEGAREEREKQAKESFRKAKQISSSIPENPYISPKVWELFRSS